MHWGNVDVHKVRHAGFSGSWYPNDPHSLEIFLSDSLSQAQNEKKKEKEDASASNRFAILPHAGLSYSSRGIAPFFLHLPIQAEKLLILAPSHYTELPPDLFSGGDFLEYQTPLGSIPCFDFTLGQKGSERALENEHAVEMVLPFLALYNKHAERPVSVSSALISQVRSKEAVDFLASQLLSELGETNLRDKKTLVIASSDFTHYGRRFGHTPYEMFAPSLQMKKVQEHDLALSSLLSQGEVEKAFAFCTQNASTVCGIAAALIVSALARKVGAVGRMEQYYTSNDIYPSSEDEFVAYSTILWS